MGGRGANTGKDGIRCATVGKGGWGKVGVRSLGNRRSQDEDARVLER